MSSAAAESAADMAIEDDDKILVTALGIGPMNARLEEFDPEWRIISAGYDGDLRQWWAFLQKDRYLAEIVSTNTEYFNGSGGNV